MLSLKTRDQVTLKQLRCIRAAFLAVPVMAVGILARPLPVSALAYVGSPTGAQVDRFSSGFGTTLYSNGTPVPNTNSSYIGLGYNLSGVGWLQGTGLTAGYEPRRVQSVTMITPLNFALAAHYSNLAYFQGDNLDFVGSQGHLFDTNGVAITNPGVADFAVGTLAQALAPSQDVAAYRILDVASQDYNGLPAVVYGSQLDNNGPTIGNAVMLGGGGYDWATPPDTAVVGRANSWQGGDSGSPLFISYKAPGSSTTQLTLAGTCWTAKMVNSYLPSTAYFGSVAGTVGVVNGVIQSEGYALKWTIYDNPSDPANTAPGWTGAAGNGDFASTANWSNSSVPNNLPVLWNADTANGQTNIALGSSNVSLRGMLFKASTSTAGFTISGTGTLSVDYTGIRNESSATQTFNVPITLLDSQNWEAANGNLVFNGNIDTSSGGNNYLVAVGGNDNTTINGVISGSGLLAKDNAGTLTLTAANTYSGNTIIHNGTLALGANGTITGGASLLFVGGNGTFNLGAQNVLFNAILSEYGAAGQIVLGGGSVTDSTTMDGSIAYAGSIVGSGTLFKDQSGVLNMTGTDTHAGVTQINRGILRISSAGALSANANLVINANDVSALELGAGNFTEALGSGAGQIQFAGSGNAGFGAYGGDRIVNLGGNGATVTWGAGYFVGANTNLILATASSTGMLDFQNSINLNGGNRTILVNGGNTAVNAQLSGVLSNGGITKAGTGTLELTAANTYAGPTMVTAGTLLVSGTLAGGTTVNVQNAATFAYTNSSALNAAVTVNGGTYIYNSPATYTGNLTFNSGTIGGTGNLSNTAITLNSGDAIAPGYGNPGTLGTGSEIWAANGKYIWQINNLSGYKGASSGWDWLNISGNLGITASAGGRFIVALQAGSPLAGWNPDVAGSWTIATASSGISGFSASDFSVDTTDFAQFNSLGNGIFSFQTSGNNLNLIFSPQATPEPAPIALLLIGFGYVLIRRPGRTRMLPRQ